MESDTALSKPPPSFRGRHRRNPESRLAVLFPGLAVALPDSGSPFHSVRNIGRATECWL